MNIAFPAIAIFLLLLPGIFFQYTIRRTRSSENRIASGEFASEAIASSLVAIIIHVLSILIVKWLFYEIDFEAIIVLLSGWPKLEAAKEKELLGNAALEPILVLLYLLITSLAGLFLGRGARFSIRKLRLDIRFPLLRLENIWYYILFGDHYVFSVFDNEKIRNKSYKSSEAKRKEPDFTFITALLEQPQNGILYWGLLEDITFNSDGTLESLVLKDAHRRKLSADVGAALEGEATTEEAVHNHLAQAGFLTIKGHRFVIPYSNVRNLNVHYFKFK